MIISKTSEPQNMIMSKETKSSELEFGKNTCDYIKHYLKTNLNQQWWGHITWIFDDIPSTVSRGENIILKEICKGSTLFGDRNLNLKVWDFAFGCYSILSIQRFKHIPVIVGLLSQIYIYIWIQGLKCYSLPWWLLSPQMFLWVCSWDTHEIRSQVCNPSI